MKIVGNLRELIEDSAAGYIANNSEDFRSQVPGPKGDDGAPGPQGQGVHHLKGTSTTDSEGDFGSAGELDTYTFYADANEQLPLSWFVVRNGKDAYQYAVENGFQGSIEEFNQVMGNTVELVARAEAAAESAELDRIQTGIDRIVVEEDTVITVDAKDVAVAASAAAVESKNVVLSIFLGSKAVDPTVDNDGNPLVEGVMYYNNVQNMLKIWTGSEWATGAFAAEGAVVSFNGRDGAVSLTNGDVTVAVGKDVSDAIKYSEADKVLTDVNKVSLSTDTSIVAGMGEMTWNATENTVDIGLNGATLQVGQEQLVRVRNNSGVSITNGMAVMATGTVGNSGKITVAKANLTQANARYVLGIVTETIADGADGFVTTFGKVRGIQTNGANYGETWVDGDVLYVKDSGNGVLTKVVPTDAQVKLPVAIVVNAHGTNGTIFVRVSSIDENASKVELASKANSNNSVLTGVPVAPTANVGTNTTQIATTAYVVAEINKVEEW